MRLHDFRAMIDRMVEEIPPQYREGIADVVVSHRVLGHPDRDGVYTMGECIPVDVGADHPPSRIVLYYGSFSALARERDGFDWRSEAWETLTHEVRHHLEWKANSQDLEEYDWAAEQGFARADDEVFDPLFFLSGEAIGPQTYQVDDDVFFDRVARDLPETAELEWRGRRYRVAVPRESLPLFLVLRGVTEPPAGDLILVFRRNPGLRDLFSGKRRPTEREVEVEPLG